MATNKFGLVRFRDYLTSRPAPGSSAPPATIKAADLDNNFDRLVLMDDPTGKIFKVSVTESGQKLEFKLTLQPITVCIGATTKTMYVLGTPPQ
jgi:hypothetical protein